MARLSFRCDEELVAAVDLARGDVARERWLRRAVEQALGSMGANDADPPRVSFPAPAPAEQPSPELEEFRAEQYRLNAAAAEQPEERPNDNPLTSHQPYRQHVPGPNVENIRSSSQREFRPYPKGGKR